MNDLHPTEWLPRTYPVPALPAGVEWRARPAPGASTSAVLATEISCPAKVPVDLQTIVDRAVERLRADRRPAPWPRVVMTAPELPPSAPAIGEEDLTDENADAYSSLINEGLSLSEYKRRIEEECIGRALRQTNGNITRAAVLLKMKRPRLSQLVKKYGLSSPTG